MTIEKARAPKGMSYPLRSSSLANALAARGVTLDTHLIMRPSDIFFDAHFWPPNANVAHERLYVRVAAVPSANAHAARKFVDTSVLPDLLAWVAELLKLPNASPKRRAEQYFRRDWPAA